MESINQRVYTNFGSVAFISFESRLTGSENLIEVKQYELNIVEFTIVKFEKANRQLVRHHLVRGCSITK